jgi:hypothetical protein
MPTNELKIKNRAIAWSKKPVLYENIAHFSQKRPNRWQMRERRRKAYKTKGGL